MRELVIENCDMFATPDTPAELWEILKSYTGGEGVAAMTAAGMAINLCAKIQRESPAIPVPDGLELWRADEVAECLNYRRYIIDHMGLYSKLWDISATAENPTPAGGDGSNGTVETPDGQLDPDNGDKAGQWWDQLTLVEAAAIATAYHDSFSDFERDYDLA
jgi:hypothetical protein